MASEGESCAGARIAPLTKRRSDGTLYTRLPQIEQQIQETLALAPEALISRAEKREFAPETICYLYQHLPNTNLRRRLFRLLLTLYIEPNIGIDDHLQHDVEDIKSNILKAIVRHLHSPDGAGDFAQITFYKYLEARKYDAIRRSQRDRPPVEVEPLRDDLEIPDDRQDPFQHFARKEELQMLEKELTAEEHDLVLRACYLEMPIGSDDWKADKGKGTLASFYQVSGRAIRYRLEKIKEKLRAPCKCK